MFLILRKSCLTENKSNITLNFISKWVEYAHYLFFKLQGTIMNLENKSTVFEITVNETVVTEIYIFEKIQEGLLFIWVSW